MSDKSQIVPTGCLACYVKVWSEIGLTEVMLLTGHPVHENRLVHLWRVLRGKDREWLIFTSKEDMDRFRSALSDARVHAWGPER